MHDVTLITISGEDKPGILASLFSVLAEHNGSVLDIGQAVIHQTLSLGVLTQVPESESWQKVRAELEEYAEARDLKIRFKSVKPYEYDNWVTGQGKQRHIITVLGRVLTAEAVASVAHIVREHRLNVDYISRLSGRIPLDHKERPTMACIEMSVRGTPRDANAMRAEFLDLAHELGIDIAFQVDNVHRRNRRVVVFDMDSTLVQGEVIDEMARVAGVGEEVARITERAMHGEIEFEEGLRQRLALVKGLDEAALDEVAESLTLTEGAEKLIATLKHLGYKVAIISGGFTYFCDRIKQHLDLDYVFANQLEIVDGKLTGEVVGDIIDGPRKAECVREIAESENILLEQVIAVGDGANDLPMLSVAGLGIAFQAKPVVRESARSALSTVGLDGILYLIGVRDRETLAQFQEDNALR